jgi:hypothetical protein
MRKRWRWLSLVAASLLGAAALAVLLEPTGTARALLAGEPFYQGRPARYWREVLRECGRNGHISQETATRFGSTKDALPVLRVCAGDPDRNVRWPAVNLLGQGDAPTQPAREVLVAALDDEDVEVRLQAVQDVVANLKGELEQRAGKLRRQALAPLTAPHLRIIASIGNHSDVSIAHSNEFSKKNSPKLPGPRFALENARTAANVYSSQRAA